MNELINYLLSSAVIAAVVSALTSFITNHISEKNEIRKSKMELIMYQYKSLYDVLLNINIFGGIDAGEDESISYFLTLGLRDKFADIEQCHIIVAPLLSEHLRKDVEKAAYNCDMKFDLIRNKQSEFEAKNGKLLGKDSVEKFFDEYFVAKDSVLLVNECIDVVQKYEETLLEAINQQLQIFQTELNKLTK